MRIVSAKETEITHTNGSCCRRYQPVVLLFKWKFLRISCSLIVECIKMKFMDVIWLASNDGFLLLIINQTMSGRAVKRCIIAIGLFCVNLAFGTWLSIQQLIIALFMMRHICNFFVSSIKRMMEQKPFLCNVLTTETGIRSSFSLRVIKHSVQFNFKLLVYKEANNATFHTDKCFSIGNCLLIKRNWSLKPIKQFDWFAWFGFGFASSMNLLRVWIVPICSVTANPFSSVALV